MYLHLNPFTSVHTGYIYKRMLENNQTQLLNKNKNITIRRESK